MSLSLFSRRNTIALCAGAFLAFLLWWWFSRIRPSNGPQAFVPASEMDRIEYAVVNARSWQATTDGTQRGQPLQTQEDVVCPFDSHTVTRTTAPSGETTVLEEFIETRETLYAREGKDPWRSQPSPGIGKCRSGPSAGPASLVDTLERLKASARLRRGPLTELKAGNCRILEFLAEDSNVSLASLCVDDETHLPYELHTPSIQVQYSNWNLPVAIDVPVVPSYGQAYPQR